MEKISLNFDKAPQVLPTLYQAIFTKRSGITEKEKLPQISAQYNKVQVNERNLKNYCDVCQIAMSNELPILYPHVLSGVLHLHILTHEKFPFGLLGAIHKYNTVKKLAALPKNAFYDIKAWLGEAKYHSKGIEFELHTQMSANGKVVWEETSYYYKRKRFPNLPKLNKVSFVSEQEPTCELAKWHMDKWAGKKYAAICKDFNPIHISSLLAKAFGFKKDLAHGFCSAAQALGKLDEETMLNKTIKIYFKGPSYIDNQMSLKAMSDNSHRYDVFCGKNKRPVISIEY